MATDEFAFDYLRASDTLLIQTANSTYQFSVIDPQSRLGMLSGGSLGAQPVRASFLCSVGVKEKFSGQDSRRMKVGARAVFLYTSEDGERHIVTSAIKKLDHRR